ncbi:MAG: cyclic nucleotide-binding domain-containing protein [Deltaproteobacteria bacterium]|nr:cyclic nucleotide-binding domain-containing protein [Deltaproteobacteria bacterium]
MTVNDESEISLFLKNPIFEGMPEEILNEIAGAVQSKVVPANTIVFRQNEARDNFYIINSGRVRVFREDESGIETDLNFLGPGDSFGELAQVTNKPRTASVETLEETRLLILTKDQFEHILKKYPDIYANVIKVMSEMIRRDELKLQRAVERQYQAPRMSWLDFLAIFVVTVLFAFIFNLSNPHRISVVPKFYNPDEVPKADISLVKKSYEKGESILVDARPSNFFDQEHIKNAVNLPLSMFEIMYMMEDLAALDKTKKIIVYGRTISALYDEEVARKLKLRGHEDVQIFKAGLSGWKKKGYPIEP